MSTKTIIALVVLAAVVVGGYFAINSKKAAENAGVENEGVEGEVAQESGKKMAFSEFLKQGGSYKCTVHQSVNNTDTEGVTYISGDMIRGEYTVEMQDVDITSSLIVRDGYTYSWSSALPNMGFKSKMVANTTGNTNAGASGSYGFNAEQIGDYNCEAWAADSSKFVVPTNITWKEVGA